MWDKRWQLYHDWPTGRINVFTDAGLVTSMATRVEVGREFIPVKVRV